MNNNYDRNSEKKQLIFWINKLFNQFFFYDKELMLKNLKPYII